MSSDTKIFIYICLAIFIYLILKKFFRSNPKINDSYLDSMDKKMKIVNQKREVFKKSNKMFNWYSYLESNVFTQIKYGHKKEYQMLTYTKLICGNNLTTRERNYELKFNYCYQEIPYEIEFSIRKLPVQGEVAMQFTCPKCNSDREVSLDMIAFPEMLERHNEQIGKATTFQSVKSSPIGAIDFNF